MATGKDTITGTESVKDALITKHNDDMTELFAILTEVENARDGESNLLAKQNVQDTAIAALAAGSGVVVSSNDTTAGFLNGKATAGEGIALVEGSDGGNETLAFHRKHLDITDKTGNYTLDADDLRGGQVFTNDGAAGEITYTLPAGSDGYHARFNVVDAQYLKITANGAETFRYVATQSAGGGYIRCNTVGGYCEIFWNGTEWIIHSINTIWNVDE